MSKNRVRQPTYATGKFLPQVQSCLPNSVTDLLALDQMLVEILGEAACLLIVELPVGTQEGSRARLEKRLAKPPMPESEAAPRPLWQAFRNTNGRPLPSLRARPSKSPEVSSSSRSSKRLQR